MVFEEEPPPQATRTRRVKRKTETAAFGGVAKTKLPQKHLLELILDTLQRRDIHEIFAEPVDPKEVEDYYAIVKEPMDFGTMRAKLHEGMYQNLEQFEHDLFLIPTNAMQFNPTGSIYYRQARAICELAENLFRVLKTDPQHFELEFSRSTRRSIRRVAVETKDKDPYSSTKCSVSAPLVVSRKSKGSRQLNNGAAAASKNCCVVSSGAGENREAGRRCTFKSWQPSSKNNLNGAMFYIYPKQLILIQQQNTCYKESLMSFVKDLGPTAQNIAQKKLQGNNICHQTPSCSGNARDLNPSNASRRWVLALEHSGGRPTTSDSELKSRNKKKSIAAEYEEDRVVAGGRTGTTSLASCRFSFEMPWLKLKSQQHNNVLHHDGVSKPIFPESSNKSFFYI